MKIYDILESPKAWDKMEQGKKLLLMQELNYLIHELEGHKLHQKEYNTKAEFLGEVTMLSKRNSNINLNLAIEVMTLDGEGIV